MFDSTENGKVRPHVVNTLARRSCILEVPVLYSIAFHVDYSMELPWKKFPWKFHGVFHMESYAVSIENVFHNNSTWANTYKNSMRLDMFHSNSMKYSTRNSAKYITAKPGL